MSAEEAMSILQGLSRMAGLAAISATLLLPTESAFASKEGRDALLGAGIGAIAGGLLGHGRPAPIIGGAIAGAVVGDALAPHRKYYGYYGYYRPYRYYAYWRPHRYWRNYYYSAYYAPYRYYAYWQPYHYYRHYAYYRPYRYFAYWRPRHYAHYAWRWQHRYYAALPDRHYRWRLVRRWEHVYVG